MFILAESVDLDGQRDFGCRLKKVEDDEVSPGFVVQSPEACSCLLTIMREPLAPDKWPTTTTSVTLLNINALTLCNESEGSDFQVIFVTDCSWRRNSVQFRVRNVVVRDIGISSLR